MGDLYIGNFHGKCLDVIQLQREYGEEMFQTNISAEAKAQEEKNRTIKERIWILTYLFSKSTDVSVMHFCVLLYVRVLKNSPNFQSRSLQK